MEAIGKHFREKRGTVGRRIGGKITLIKIHYLHMCGCCGEAIIQYNSTPSPYNETQM